MVLHGCPTLGEESGLFSSLRPVTECGLVRLGLFHPGTLRPAVSSSPAGGRRPSPVRGLGGTRQHPGSLASLFREVALRHTQTHVPGTCPRNSSARRSREHAEEGRPVSSKEGGQTAECCAGTGPCAAPVLSVGPSAPPRGTGAPGRQAEHLRAPSTAQHEIQTQPTHTHCTLHAAQPIGTHTSHTHACTHVPVPIHTQHGARHAVCLHEHTHTHCSRDAQSQRGNL